MADTSAAKGLTVEQWDAKYFKECVTENRFSSEMGKSPNNIIQVKSDLTKKKGDTINFALVNRLKGAGVDGSDTLEGNEEDMDTRSCKVKVNQKRHAVRVPKMEEQKSAIPLREAAKSLLKDWNIEVSVAAIIAALRSVKPDGDTSAKTYETATEANLDAWLALNSDRVLFGAAKSNNASNDHSLSLANIDNTNDKLSASSLKLMKRMASEADPKIRPVRTKKGGQKWFVVYANTRAFRDLSEDATIIAAQKDALVRGKDNPLFTGGDLLYDGMIIKEIEEIPIITGVGAGGIDVGQVFLCGAQAIGWAWAQMAKTIVETFDYEDKTGVAVGEIRGIEKLWFGTGADMDNDEADPKQHGVVTGYFAAVPDA